MTDFAATGPGHQDQTFITGVNAEGKRLVLASVPGAGPRIIATSERLKTLAQNLDHSLR